LPDLDRINEALRYCSTINIANFDDVRRIAAGFEVPYPRLLGLLWSFDCVGYNDPEARKNMERQFWQTLALRLWQAYKKDQEIVFVGIGEPSLRWDSYGPKIADRLGKESLSNVVIYGGTDYRLLPIHFYFIRRGEKQLHTVSKDVNWSSTSSITASSINSISPRHRGSPYHVFHHSVVLLHSPIGHGI